LKDKHVVVIPDADELGRKHARQVARSLFRLAASVKLVELPTGKDLTDWAQPASNGTRDGLLTLMKVAPELTEAEIASWKLESSRPPQESFLRGLRLTTLGELLEEPDEAVSWLLYGMLPAGGLSLLAAKPKVGKSTLARCLALAVARGEEFLGRSTIAGSVIYLALEEKRDEVRKHFADLGAMGDEPIHIHCSAAPQDALPALCEAVKQFKPVLVIVDPVLRMVRVRDAND
jgi:AAA domain